MALMPLGGQEGAESVMRQCIPSQTGPIVAAMQGGSDR